MAFRWTRYLAAVLCLALGAAPAWGVDDATVDGLTREVRHAVLAPPGKTSDSVLIALRQLHDERLRPLFAELASRDAAAARLHGIFGLADLSEDGKVSIVQIAGLRSKELRARALGAAIGADYLTTDQMRQVLSWPELDPSVELLVMSKLMQEGEAPDVDRLREIAAKCTADQTTSKVFAKLLIAHLEEDSDAKEVQSLLEGLSDADRAMMVAFAMRQILVLKLDNLEGFVVAENGWATTRPRLHLQSLAALLVIDPDLGLSEWRAAYDAETSLSQRIRLGLILLNAVEHVDASAFDPLVGDEVQLLDLMGRAGRSVASHQGEAEALWRLLRQEHDPTLAWVFDTLDGMPVEQRLPVLRGIMDHAMEVREAGADVPAYLYEIARTLESSEAGASGPYLAQAAGRSDTPLCEAFLSALMETKPHVAWDEQHEPAWPSRRCAVLAAIAEARAGRTLDDRKLELLTSAGMGGEQLPEAFRVQAAWLALCQLRKEREALAEVLAPSDE